MKPNELKISVGNVTRNRVNAALQNLRWAAKRKKITLSNNLNEDGVTATDWKSENYGLVISGDEDLKAQADGFISELCEKYKEITAANYKNFIAELNGKQEHFKEYYTFEDKRKTIAELQTEEGRRKEESAKAMQERAIEDEADNILKARFKPENRLIMIAECVNDSDGMTDYYNPCKPLKKWILAEVPEGKRDLRILQETINRFPKLRGLKWTEHREGFSMNHFGYSLTSEYIDLSEEAELYRGGNTKKGFYRVDFSPISYEGTKEIWDEKPDSESAQNKVFSFDERGAHFTHNKEKNGLEIRFKTKPSQEVINTLKSNGFRWSGFNKCWYKRYYQGIEEATKKIFTPEIQVF